MTGASYRAISVLVCAATTGGCTHSDAIEIREVSLSIDGGPPAALQLPTRINDRLPDHRTEYTLSAQVPIPPAWRGRELSVSIPHLLAHATLHVDGTLARSAQLEPREGYRSRGPHVWIVPASHTDVDALSVEISVDYSWTQAGWIDVVPRVALGPLGDWHTRTIATINRWIASAAIWTMLTIMFTYAVMYFRDRRRREYGFSAIRTGLVPMYFLYLLGSWQAWLGRWEVPAVASTLCAAAVLAVPTTTYQFQLDRRTHRGWYAVLAGMAILSLALSDPFSATLLGYPTLLIVGGTVAYQTVYLIRIARRRPAPVGVYTELIGWLMLGSFSFMDFLPWLGFGEPLGGLRIAGVGLSAYALAQFISLSSAHLASVREVGALNVELQRQIGERSGQLSEALARLAASHIGARERLKPGATVDGRYRVEREIGAGAMGSVFEVERLRDRRRYALKLPTSSDARLLARFAREAQLASEVTSDRVVRIADVGFASEGFMFLVMELVDGISLKECAEDFGAPWTTAAVGDIARGLAAIHDKGVVHRDLKPANVIVTNYGSDNVRCKIVDFGISALIENAPLLPEPTRIPDSEAPAPTGNDTVTVDTKIVTPPSSDGNLHLTQVGDLVGTPSYMAPELAKGSRAASTASDVFSLGLLAHEVLCSERPFHRPPIVDALADAPIPAPSFDLAERRPDLSGEAAELLRRALSARPDERPTASDIARALAETA